MSLIQDLYGLTANEAMNLSDKETQYLLGRAQLSFMQMASTSPAMRELMQSRLQPAIRDVRQARTERGEESGSGSSGVGAPPSS